MSRFHRIAFIAAFILSGLMMSSSASAYYHHGYYGRSGIVVNFGGDGYYNRYGNCYWRHGRQFCNGYNNYYRNCYWHHGRRVCNW